MDIKLSPQRRDGPVTITKKGDVLTINGEAFDLTPLPDGGSLPGHAIDCELIVGDVHRKNGAIQITLIAPHGPNPTQEESSPEPRLNAADGVIVSFDGVTSATHVGEVIEAGDEN